MTSAARRLPFVFLTLLFLFCSACIVLRTPFRSPDEADHLKRAYGLLHGIVLQPVGTFPVRNHIVPDPCIVDKHLLKVIDKPYPSSYINIDSGLLDFIRKNADNAVKNAHKTVMLGVGMEDFSASPPTVPVETYRFTDVLAPSPSPGTAYYFPVAYAPQALGLFVGRMLDLTVFNGYRLACFTTLLCAVSLLYYAFRLTPPSVPVLLVLSMPGVLFQFASSSLDCVTNALGVLAIAALIAGRQGNRRAFMPLLAAVSLLSVTRLYMCVLWPFVWWQSDTASRRRFTCAAFGGFIAWTGTVLTTTVDVRFTDINKKMVVSFKESLQNIDLLIFSILNTFKESSIKYMYGFYWQSWNYLQFYFLEFNSFIFLFFVFLIALTCCYRRTPQTLPGLKYATLVATGIVVASMLNSVGIWKQDLTIFGIQGRYFILPALMCLYPATRPLEKLRRFDIGMLAGGAWFTVVGVYIETATLAALTS